MKGWVEEWVFADNTNNGLAADLLGYAFERVDWLAIVDAFRED